MHLSVGISVPEERLSCGYDVLVCHTVAKVTQNMSKHFRWPEFLWAIYLFGGSWMLIAAYSKLWEHLAIRVLLEVRYASDFGLSKGYLFRAAHLETKSFARILICLHTILLLEVTERREITFNEFSLIIKTSRLLISIRINGWWLRDTLLKLGLFGFFFLN